MSTITVLGMWLAGSYSKLIDFMCHSTLGLRVIDKKRRMGLETDRTSLPGNSTVYLCGHFRCPEIDHCRERESNLCARVNDHQSGFRIYALGCRVWKIPLHQQCFTEMCSGPEEGSRLRLIDLCITQLRLEKKKVWEIPYERL